MRNTKGTHVIAVAGAEYRWRAKGNDECISIGIWPANDVGPYIGGRFCYHNRWIDNGDGTSTSSGDQLVVTSRLVKRIIEHALSKCGYNPKLKGKQLDLGPLEDIIKLDDGVRASNPRVQRTAG